MLDIILSSAIILIVCTAFFGPAGIFVAVFLSGVAYIVVKELD